MEKTSGYPNFVPIPVPEEKARSAIELRFPHIARNLSSLWRTDGIESYMNSLLIDTRGGRQGFPEDAQEELMFLSGLLWQLQHEDRIVEEFQTLDAFTFAAVNETDMRRCGTTGAWVLL